MFNNTEELFSGKWSISIDLNYSIEALRFLNEILQWNRENRPFPDQLVDHPYFETNIKELALVRNLVSDLPKLTFPCLKDRKLMFNTKDSSEFEEFYKNLTRQQNYSMELRNSLHEFETRDCTN